MNDDYRRHLHAHINNKYIVYIFIYIKRIRLKAPATAHYTFVARKQLLIIRLLKKTIHKGALPFVLHVHPLTSSIIFLLYSYLPWILQFRERYAIVYFVNNRYQRQIFYK